MEPPLPHSFCIDSLTCAPVVDLSKAFDHAIREVVTGWMRGRGAVKAAQLTQLGLPREVVEAIIAWIDEFGGLLRQLGSDETVCALVNRVHDGAWFQLPGDEKYVVSISSGRQWCKLGALDLQCDLRFGSQSATACPCTLQDCTSHRPFWSLGIVSLDWTDAPDAGADVFEVTYVDDEAAFGRYFRKGPHSSNSNLYGMFM